MKDIETYKPYFQHKPDCAQRTVAPDPAWQAHIEMNNVCTCGMFQALSDLEAHLSTSNGMTEEEIERIASEYDQDELNDSRQDGYVTSADVQAFELGIKCGLRYARDRGMLASSNVPVVTVDAIMEVHRKWLDDVDCYDDWIVDAFSDLRSRLTTLFPPPRH